MRKDDFMTELEKNLQDISPTERDNALLYYKDYFDDAGIENETDVIRKLDSPSVIAQEIKRDLGENVRSASEHDTNRQTAEAENSGQNSTGNEERQSTNNQSSYTSEDGSTRTVNSVQTSLSKEYTILGIKLPLWLIIVLVIVLIPVISGVLGTLIGVVFGIVGCIIGIFAGSAGLIIGGISSIVTGIISIISGTPFNGILLIGLGFVLTGVGIMLLTLAIQISTIWIPQLIRWISLSIKKMINKQAISERSAA